MDRHLIFDLGLHHGYDTEFYLNKGFKVIALEANPGMIEQARKNPVLATAEEEGRLGIVPMALWGSGGESISFYVNSVKDDWSSAVKKLAEKGRHPTREIKVATITLAQMFEQLGVPYYVKCDIEGADVIFSEQLMSQKELPAFVSAEECDARILAHFASAGYDRFQLVNQALHDFIVQPHPPREGRFVETKFTGHMSGLFGLDLPLDKWLPYHELNEWLAMYRSLTRRGFPMSDAWFDIHATKKETLAAAGSV
jgi:FkbM family methyltransferase